MKKEIKAKFEHKKKRGKHICMVCGCCVACCPNDALSFAKSKPGLTFDDMIVHNPKKCSGCGLCAKACPEGMIIIHESNERGLKSDGRAL